MFIKKLIIDGFKSYGKRVEITDFDPSFNAITGFNGSGKSNILDAICFVLGLSKLELARCHTLNDLIYKNGNAGVKTASVTMEIDNSDGKFSHSDYRDSPVIVVRREINLRNQSKYYIEGFCVTKEKLMDFFQSVSLNIQNPHFLIMQGKIVKVVSMKPTEILSMIEEAVGVSVYETKKKHNLIKIGKCDNTLNEINYMIDESIRPKLDQVLNEQKVLNEYNQMKTNYQKMIKLSIAMRYLHDKRTIETSDNNIKMNEDIIEEKEQIKAQIVDENEEIEKQIQNLQHSLDKNSSNELKQLEADVNEQQKIIQQIMTEKKMKQDQIESDTNEMKNLTTKLENETKLMHKSEAEYNKLKIDIDKLKSDLEMNEKQLHQAENNLEAINFGKSKNVDCNDGEQVTLTLTQQLLQAKDELNLIESKIHKSKLMIKQWQIELKDKSKQIDLDKNTYDQINADIQMKEKEMKQLENDIEKLEFNEEHFDEIKLKIQELKQNTSKLTDKLNELVPLVPMAKFNYAKFITDDDDIDAEQINGLVCDLFEINHPDIHSIAIEKVCGNRLFNVVVSDEQIAAKLIKRNRTERRTYLPLNKIQGRDTDMKALRLAEQMIGKGNVHYAINLIRFDPKLKNAMQYVFGDTMVCPNMNMAKKIAFTSGIMKRVVTYDGEIFDPSGTLTGGSNTANSKYDSILTVINTIKVIENELNMNKICRQQNEYEYEQIQMKYKAYAEKNSKLKLKIKEIDSLKLRQKETHYNQSLEEIETINQNIQNETNLIKNEYELNRQNLMEKIKNLEFKIENYDKFKQNELKEAQKELEMARKTLEKNKKLLDNNEKNFLKIEQQTIFHQESIKLIENQLKNLRQNIDNITEHIEKILNENLRKEEDKYQSIEQKLKIYKDNLMKQSKEIQKLQKKLIENNNKIDEIMREIKSKTYEINKIKADKKESTENIQKLLNKNQWILDEEKYFYSDHSEYQLLRQTNTNDGQQEFHKQLKLIKTKMETMKKSVNMKANIMHGQIQNEFEELLRKRDCTLKDRRKLIQYLDKVEKEKDKELRKAWEKINENFGAIFSTLLANTNARLQPISSKIQDGLEIKVSIGNVWKESLSELSGGQRSLVALSLVLSLLKYYPAPLYILDEIDAALDQSHTQNIGIMIRKHFKNAQFIIVSLKDDMFNNANVLFQTKFIDGYSTVERIEL